VVAESVVAVVLSVVEAVESVFSDAEFDSVSLVVLSVSVSGAYLTVLSNKGTILTLILYLDIPLPGKVGRLKVRKYSVKSSGFTCIYNANGSLKRHESFLCTFAPKVAFGSK